MVSVLHQKSKCDRKGPTVLLARETNGGLFGGYTDMVALFQAKSSFRRANIFSLVQPGLWQCGSKAFIKA